MGDPHEIYMSHFEAIGGLNNVMAESTSYIEADITYAGLQGTLKIWKKLPICERQETDLRVFRQTEGDNGEVKWAVDTNGKLTINEDENVLKRREISKLDNQFDFLDPNSSTFELIFKGIQKFNDKNCYVIKKTNNINGDSCEIYFNTDNLLIEKEITFKNNEESHSVFSDYRKVGAVLRAFRTEVTEQPVGNEMSIRITKYESNLDVDNTLFDPLTPDIRDYEFLNGNCAENIQIEYYMDHILVYVSIAGKRSKWILDTGANVTAIDSAFAADIGLESEGDLKGRGATNVVSFSFVKLPPLRLSGLEIREQAAASGDLKRIFRKVGWDDVVGVLGYDFISRFVLKVDYANRVISLYDPEVFDYEGNGRTIQMPLRNNKPLVEATVEGKFGGMWQVDIGAGSCDFMYPFAEQNGFLKRHGIESVGMDVGGICKQRDVQFESFELAGFIIKNPIISFPITNVSGGFGDTELVGNLGNDILRHFIVWFDYNNQRMIIEKGPDFSKKFPSDKSGIWVFFNNDEILEINFVSGNTPAAESGFQIEDIILAVDDINMEYPDGRRIFRELMSADEGTRYKVSIKRGRQVMNIELVLSDLHD